MSDATSVTLKRSQLFDEIWTISASRVAKKYNLTYSALLECCRKYSIPIPPSGYWTKLEFGKADPKPLLPEADVEEVTIPTVNSSRSALQALDIVDEMDLPSQNEQQVTAASIEEQLGKAEVIQNWGSTHNIYKREQLYEEIWTMPVSKVALKYGVSDVAIHKICQKLRIPAPPRGYWAKLQAGKSVERIPLPVESSQEIAKGTRTQAIHTNPLPNTLTSTLNFLTTEEKIQVLSAAENLRLPEANSRRSKEIITHSKVVSEWNKKDQRKEGAEKSPQRYDDSYRNSSRPFLAGVISSEALPRVYRILDALYLAAKPLQCSLTDSLSFIIRGEVVRLSIHEKQDKLLHVPTKSENMELLRYEEAKKTSRWASKPQIRKYDYIFNGMLVLEVCNGKTFKDTEKIDIEEQLGNILISMFEASQIVRQGRLAAEEAARKREEESRRREEFKKAYNRELDKTALLISQANDYQTAIHIRQYADAVESSSQNLSDEQLEWLKWARAKADWYDPNITYEDPYFGERTYRYDGEAIEPQKKW